MVMGPLLSAYWAKKVGKGFSLIDSLDHFFSPMLKGFDRFQTRLEEGYLRVIDICLKHRGIVLLSAGVIFLASLGLLGFMKMTFQPSADVGEFMVFLKADPATALENMRDKTLAIESIIRQHSEVELVASNIGGADATGADQGSNKASLYIKLKPVGERKIGTQELKEIIRKQLDPYKAELNPQVADSNAFGNQAPFTLEPGGGGLLRAGPLCPQGRECSPEDPRSGGCAVDLQRRQTGVSG